VEEGLPREAVESPSLEIFKTCLDKVLYSLLWGDPALAGGLDWVTHRGPFQPLFCGSVFSEGFAITIDASRSGFQLG